MATILFKSLKFQCQLCESTMKKFSYQWTGPSISKLLTQIRNLWTGLNLKIEYFKTEYLILIQQNLDPDLVIQSHWESRSNLRFVCFKTPRWSLILNIRLSLILLLGCIQSGCRDMQNTLNILNSLITWCFHIKLTQNTTKQYPAFNKQLIKMSLSVTTHTHKTQKKKDYGLFMSIIS